MVCVFAAQPNFHFYDALFELIQVGRSFRFGRVNEFVRVLRKYLENIETRINTVVS